MSKQEKDIIIKTKLFGFDKKGTMDYIEKIKLENEGLKRQVQDLSAKQNALLKENAMLRAKVDVAVSTPAEEPVPDTSSIAGPAVEIVDNYGEQVQARMTFENLSDLDAPVTYEMPYEPKQTATKNAEGKFVVTSNKNVTKKNGKTYISSKK
ncbi:MAG: hypothetical protein KBS43_00805 [Oscillospiraceae bacterium]|nr:hypothetical protein [Candidatus Limimonas coprohippi]MCQ2487697.1 hypothetical protein [Clostridia bacterium]